MKPKSLIALFATATLVCGAPDDRRTNPGAAGAPTGRDVGGNRPAVSPADVSGGDTEAQSQRQMGRGEKDAVPAARSLASAVHDINLAAFAQRRQLANSVDMRLRSSREIVKRAQSEARELRADAGADFKAALADVKASEKALSSALRATRIAKEADWDTSRAALAKAYQKHDDALTRLEAVAGSGR